MYTHSKCTMCAGVMVVLAAFIAACGDDEGKTSQDASLPDSAVVDAAPPDAGPDSSTAIRIEPGELFDVSADATGVVQATLDTSGGSEAFILMLQSRNTQVSRIRPYTTELLSGAYERRKSARAPRSASKPVPTPVPIPAARCGFDHRAVADLARRLEGLASPRGLGLPLPLPLPPPEEGEVVQLQVGTSDGVETIDAEVLLLSPSLVVCLDVTTDPGITLDGSDLQEIADGFENVVLPRLRIFFGQESDVNEDGHVTVLFSPLVYETGTAFVNPYDLITDPSLRPTGVAANDQELIYITPPQMLEPQMATPRAILETLAHEFQHAIYFYRKYMLNDNLNGQESVYITEGLSGLAQDLSGYQAGIFFINKTALDSWDTQSFNDLVRSGGGYYYDRPELYGGAYLLLRYLYDQAGGDVLTGEGTVDIAASPGIPWLRALVDSSELGTVSIEAAAGSALVEVATDWLTALMVDDRMDELGDPLNEDPRYNFLPTTVDSITGRQRGTSMFESFMGMVHKTGPVVCDFAEADGVIRSGGSEYLSLEASEEGTLAFRITADPTEVDLFVRIFRIR